MRAERILMRVFIEGVHVPHVSSATVQTQDDETSQATIVMPAVPGFEAEELKRAKVHIYWSDVDIRDQRQDTEWPILFDGEISADGYGKSVNHRQQMFHCTGLHTYWEQVLLYFYDTSRAPTNQTPWTTQASMQVGNQQLVWDGQIAGANLRQRLVGEVKKDSKEEYHAMVKRVFGQCMDVNNFFRQVNDRIKLTSRFTSPQDPNLDVLTGYNLLKELVDKDMTTFQGETPMMDVLKSLLSLFRYHILHNAQPVFVNKKDEKATTTRKEKAEEDVLERLDQWLLSLNIIDSTREIWAKKNWGRLSDTSIDVMATQLTKYTLRSDEKDVYATQMGIYNQQMAKINDPGQSVGLDVNSQDLITQFMLLPDMRFAPVPTCNVIYPQDQTSLSMSRQLMQEPTRSIGMAQTIMGTSLKIYTAPMSMTEAVVPAQTIWAVSKDGYHPPVLDPHRISSPFGYRTLNKHKGRKFHKGVDIASPHRNPWDFYGATVHAIDDGVVTMAGWQDESRHKYGFGLRVWLKHDNGMSTAYAHMSQVHVTAGNVVTRGQVIGNVGNSGGCYIPKGGGQYAGTHLHFETKVGGVHEDPQKTVLNKLGDVTKKTEDAPAAEVEEDSILDVPKKNTQFNDFEYLTPEEKKTGIIPYFDQDTIRAHAFMANSKDSEQVHNHYQNMLESEFWWRRYQTRSLDALNLPFNPSVVAGFPGLVIDRARSIIGKVKAVSHTISVGGGQGVASTVVQMSSPRYWDEGDPYYWVDGKVSETMSSTFKKNLPDPDKARFPPYYLQSLINVNSVDKSKVGGWWNPQVKNMALTWRPTDELYSALLGTGVQAVPYQYGTRKTVTGSYVSYNKAIDSRPEKKGDPKPPNTNTIVGEYYRLAHNDQEAAEAHVKYTTRRLGMSESEMMVSVLGATTDNGGLWYTGPSFDPQYQELVQIMVGLLTDNAIFRG